MKNAENIQKDVVAELAWDPRVDSSGIGVTVDEGIVTLQGTVGTLAAKLAAERAARRVADVEIVVDNLIVQPIPPEAHGDDAIARAALDILHWNRALAQAQISVVVNNGWLKLTGEVERFFQRRAAEDALKVLPGVKGITNLLTAQEILRPSDVQQRIEAAFRRYADLDAEQIKVELQDGIATLKGFVRSWSEREAAEEAAAAAPGIVEVRNELRIGAPVRM